MDINNVPDGATEQRIYLKAYRQCLVDLKRYIDDESVETIHQVNGQLNSEIDLVDELIE